MGKARIKTKKQMIAEIDMYCDKIRECGRQMDIESVSNSSVILIAEQIKNYYIVISDLKEEINWLEDVRNDLKALNKQD